MRKLTGRKDEISLLENALASNRPELIALYGRRRVGKTFLVREVYKDSIQFEFSGVHNVSFRDQLRNFHLKLSGYTGSDTIPADWFEAFRSHTRTKSSLFLTFITTYGLRQNQYRTQLVQNELTMDDLFG